MNSSMKAKGLATQPAPALSPAVALLCGCGRPVQYSHGDKHSCNKRVVCPTYEQLREQCCLANALVLAYCEKRNCDGYLCRIKLPLPVRFVADLATLFPGENVRMKDVDGYLCIYLQDV